MALTSAVKKNLEALASFIETVPPKEFDMEEVIDIVNSTKYRKAKNGYVTGETIGQCGTTCCLAG